MSDIITGREIYAAAGARGAGIGAGRESSVNSIQISGSAKITAMGAPTGGGAAIGEGERYGAGSSVGTISIEDSVELYAYSRYSGDPAISAGSPDNSANANIVNAVITNVVFTQNESAEIPVRVIDDSTNALLRTLTLPAGCHGFAFSQGAQSGVFLLDVYNTANTTLIGAFVNTADETREISSRSGPGAYNVVNVRFQDKPSVPLPTHANVTQTSADLISLGHQLNTGSYAEGRFEYARDQAMTTGRTDVPWQSYQTPGVTEQVTGLTPNTCYYYRTYASA